MPLSESLNNSPTRYCDGIVHSGTPTYLTKDNTTLMLNKVARGLGTRYGSDELDRAATSYSAMQI